MKLLFICTHNRCRSILAEAITNFYGKGQFVAKSAGSQPVGEVHPLSLRYLKKLGIPTDGLSSQSWDEHEAWQPDIVITVCDSAANEACPVWFGKSVKAHWGLADPSRLDGTEEEVEQAFSKTIQTLVRRIERLIELNVQDESLEALPDVLKSVADL